MWLFFALFHITIAVSVAIAYDNSTAESVDLLEHILEWLLPSVLAIITLIYTIRTYNRNKKRDYKGDTLLAMDIVTSFHKEIAQKVRSAAVGLPNSGLSSRASQKFEELRKKALNK